MNKLYIEIPANEKESAKLWFANQRLNPVYQDAVSFSLDYAYLRIGVIVSETHTLAVKLRFPGAKVVGTY